MRLVDFERPLKSTITTLADSEKELFLDLVFQMLKWDPNERKSAKVLLKHPRLEF